MTTGILFLILLITICFAILKYRKATVISFAIFGIGFILIGYGILPAILLKSLEVSNSASTHLDWKKKNAIVVLGFGNAKLSDGSPIKSTVFGYSRVFTAAQVYSSCKKSGQRCVLVLSGGDPQHLGISEAEVFRNELISIGVDDFDIEVEPNSQDTYQNAKFTNAILRSGNYDYVVLITSGFHIKRSLEYFNSFGIHPVPISSDYVNAQISFLPLGYNFASTDLASHEIVGIARLWVYNFLGWNKPTEAARSQ
jgi:uncharacterized SAM-binding protein YcdF (DUF218 family)